MGISWNKTKRVKWSSRQRWNVSGEGRMWEWVRQQEGGSSTKSVWPRQGSRKLGAMLEEHVVNVGVQCWKGWILSLELIQNTVKPQQTKGWRFSCCPSQCAEHPLLLVLNISKCRTQSCILGYLPPSSAILQASAKPDPAAGMLCNQILCSIYVFKYILFRPKPFNLQLKWYSGQDTELGGRRQRF